MNDLVIGASIAAFGTIVGGVVTGCIGWLISERQATALRKERSAAEEERKNVRLEDAYRNERRDRIRPIRDHLDRLAKYHIEMARDSLDIERLIGEKGLGREDAERVIVSSPEKQASLMEAIESLSVANARAPARLSVKLVELMEVFRGYGKGDHHNAKLVVRASAIHKAIEEYVAQGTIDGGPPDQVEITPEQQEHILQGIRKDLTEKGLLSNS